MERIQNCTEILDLIPIGVFWKDRNSVYLGCNSYTALHAGLKSPEDIIGKTDYDLCWKELADKYQADDKEVIDSKHDKPQYFEEYIADANGKKILAKTTKIPLYDDDGNIYGILGIWQDISEFRDMLVNINESLSNIKTKANIIDDKCI